MQGRPAAECGWRQWVPVLLAMLLTGVVGVWSARADSDADSDDEGEAQPAAKADETKADKEQKTEAASEATSGKPAETESPSKVDAKTETKGAEESTAPAEEEGAEAKETKPESKAEAKSEAPAEGKPAETAAEEAHVKHKPSEWIVKWQQEGKHRRIILRIERLLREGRPGQIAAVDAALKRQTNKDLIATLINARLAEAAASGEIGVPTDRELAQFVPMAEVVAKESNEAAQLALRTIRNSLRKVLPNKKEGEEESKTDAHKAVADLLAKERSSLEKAAAAAQQARVLYTFLYQYYKKSPDTGPQAADASTELRQLARTEKALKELIVKEMDETALDNIITAMSPKATPVAAAEKTVKTETKTEKEKETPTRVTPKRKRKKDHEAAAPGPEQAGGAPAEGAEENKGRHKRR